MGREHSPLREALRPQTCRVGASPSTPFEVVLLCGLSKGESKAGRGSPVSHVGPTLVGYIPGIHVQSPQYVEGGLVSALQSLALNSIVRGHSGCFSPHEYQLPCSFSFRHASASGKWGRWAVGENIGENRKPGRKRKVFTKRKQNKWKSLSNKSHKWKREREMGEGRREGTNEQIRFTCLC